MEDTHLKDSHMETAHDYDDIINMDRPVSKRQRITLEERAAQFGAFAALTGYDSEIEETAKAVIEQVEHEYD